MNSREERLAHDALEWDRWRNVTPPAEMPPELEKIWEEYAMTGEVGAYAIADFIGPCVYGDVIWKGDTVRPDGSGEFEHKECAEEGGPMFQHRDEPDTDPCMQDVELPGMWERSDFE